MKIEEKLVNLLKNKKLKISTAESCTGGLLAGKIVDVSGASDVFDMGFVTYANTAKMELLSVSEESLNKFGAVSEQVVGEMAEGARKKAKANIGVATSGIAGPTGGTKSKPVGMVCFGVSIDGKIYTYTYIFKNISRQYIRKSSVNYAINKTIYLLNHYDFKNK